MQKEEVRFENTYLMTQERYLWFCSHPRAPKAIRQLRTWKILQVAGLFFSALALVVVGVLRKEWMLTLAFALFVLLFLYRIFLGRKVQNKRMYAQIRKSQSAGEWKRAVLFGESGIEMQDVNMKMEMDYQEITRLTEDGEYLLLWRGEDYVLRLVKDGFTVGTYADFVPFIQKKIAQNAPDRGC